LNAPVPEFFDVTMVGNILNRFAKDMETTDVTIPEYLNMFLFQLFSLSSVVGLCIWSVPPFIVLVVPVVIFVVYMFLRFAPFSRDIKRLESVSRTPVYSSFSETLTGKSFLLLINPSFLILSSDIWLQVWRQLEHMV
jgi:ATP-binding cassette subfamily C (CFTR/MRP) protein 1